MTRKTQVWRVDWSDVTARYHPRPIRGACQTQSLRPSLARDAVHFGVSLPPHFLSPCPVAFSEKRVFTSFPGLLSSSGRMFSVYAGR
ncbi:Hypothetical protein NTJ_08023 [Nesidiocoris tenuis]|uniref:Uncharacterized protein n=1 Tax=Nesidiocoris tenuis TaxID=355587 RepID=A0ABN7ASN3_9HEMI|nr:Hypothetical protein NTJ_08023 [Nesidiocoris tenuis]